MNRKHYLIYSIFFFVLPWHTYSLEKGWNLRAFDIDQSVTVEDYFDNSHFSHSGTLESVWAWNADTFDWEVYFPQQTTNEPFSKLVLIHPEQGYWIKTKSQTTFDIPPEKKGEDAISQTLKELLSQLTFNSHSMKKELLKKGMIQAFETALRTIKEESDIEHLSQSTLQLIISNVETLLQEGMVKNTKYAVNCFIENQDQTAVLMSTIESGVIYSRTLLDLTQSHTEEALNTAKASITMKMYDDIQQFTTSPFESCQTPLTVSLSASGSNEFEEVGLGRPLFLDGSQYQNNATTHSWYVWTGATSSSGTWNRNVVFGDDAPIGQLNVTFIPPFPGYYSLSLCPENGNNCVLDGKVFVSGTGNMPPQAHLEIIGNTEVGQSVVLDASKSFDPENDSLWYHWQVIHFSLPEGDVEYTTVINTRTNATQVILEDLKAGGYDIMLTVTDGQENASGSNKAEVIRYFITQ